MNVNAESVGGLTVGEKLPPSGGGVGGEGKGSAYGGTVEGGLRGESRDLLYSPSMLWREGFTNETVDDVRMFGGDLDAQSGKALEELGR